MAAVAHLPRLKDLGVDIVWLMPIHPIGLKNRKGTLGSPYSVRDYYGVNTEFGTLADLKHFVNAAHALGMFVILDWVANHTAWDNNLVTEHPEYYVRDWNGDFRPTPWWDWSDIIDLDYSLSAVRQYMTEAMCYWVREANIDGYRCDVAGFVPVDFWNTARKMMEAIKPVFLLAEWEFKDLHAEAFDMTYAWSWNETTHKLCMGLVDVQALFVYYSWNEKAYPQDCYRMTFVSNHDKNSWEGTEYEQFGAGLEAAIVLSVVGEGLPLVYNGQEAGNKKRLEFFEKDPIVWQEHAMTSFYKKLFTLKKSCTALWNGHWGARMIRVPNDAETQVLSFVRQDQNGQVFCVLNFSAVAQKLLFKDALHHGKFKDYFSDQQQEFLDDTILELPAWGYKVFVR